jgi:hypothetical protein
VDGLRREPLPAVDGTGDTGDLGTQLDLQPGDDPFTVPDGCAGGLILEAAYAPSRQHRRDLASADYGCARTCLCYGRRDEPRGKCLLPLDARAVRRDGKNGLLPDDGADRRNSADCRNIPGYRSSLGVRSSTRPSNCC